MSQIELNNIKLYHIVHLDKLPSILSSGEAGELVCDSDVQKQRLSGTTIGMSKIKERRMNELTLNCYPDLYVGDCVPFYFCPRSIMLYIFNQNNHPDIVYRGGQQPIVHLMCNMMDVINWADQERRRWAFTSSNAGSRYFDAYCDVSYLDKLNWEAINSNNWKECKEEKQAEFLVEKSVPWHLVREIGVYSHRYQEEICRAISNTAHQPEVKVERQWYY